MKIAGRVVVVTGGSSGIGRALSIELGLRGATVILAARSKEMLEESALIMRGYGIEHLLIPFDITSDTSIRNLLHTVIKKYQRIDIFINNAGVGLFENVVRSTRGDLQKVFNTNFWGPLTLMQQLIPMLRGGMIVNISSAAAKYAPYQQGAYAASKAALERIHEAVGLEERHIKTLLVIPDRTDTPFMQHVIGPKEQATLALQLKFASPEAVAQKIARAIEKEKSICYTTLKARIYTLLSALTPGLVRKIIQKTSV